MDQTLTIQQLAEVADLSRTQIDQWISREHFKPRNPVENGKARAFTIEDAVVLGTLAELVRIGMTPTVAAMHVQNLHTFTNDDALLVVTQGPIEMAMSRGKGATMTFYDPDNPSIHHHVIRAKELIKFATNPKVRSMAVVNLSEVEKRAMKVIGKA